MKAPRDKFQQRGKVEVLAWQAPIIVQGDGIIIQEFPDGTTIRWADASYYLKD